jgi:hypothetical protein
MNIDMVVPILRSGAFTGKHIASKLQISNVLPAQYKYTYSPLEKIEKKFEFPKLSYSIPANANILIADSNTVGADIAKKVIADVKHLFPEATLYFASANLDQSITSLNHIEHIFFGSLSNESRLISKEEADKKSITNDILIFPWENLEEQWQEINANQ